MTYFATSLDSVRFRRERPRLWTPNKKTDRCIFFLKKKPRHHPCRWKTSTPSPAWTSGTPRCCCASKRPSRATRGTWNKDEGKNARGGETQHGGTEKPITHAFVHTHTHRFTLNPGTTARRRLQCFPRPLTAASLLFLTGRCESRQNVNPSRPHLSLQRIAANLLLLKSFAGFQVCVGGRGGTFHGRILYWEPGLALSKEHRPHVFVQIQFLFFFLSQRVVYKTRRHVLVLQNLPFYFNCKLVKEQFWSLMCDADV